MANPQSSSPLPGAPNRKNGEGRPGSTLDQLQQIADAPPERRETFVRAFTQVFLFILVLGAIGGGYAVWAEKAGKVFEVIKKTRDIQRQDSFDKLKEASKELKEGLAVQEEARLVAMMAETSVLLWCIHKDESAKDDALRYTELAESRNIEKAERYSASVYLKICQGQLAEAEQYATRLVQKGAGGDARILHSLGMALLAQGRTLEAQGILKQASEKGAGNPRFPAGYADAELALGNYFEAQQQYSRAVNNNGNHVHARLGKLLAEGLGGFDPQKVIKDMLKVLAGPPEPSPGDKAFAAYAMAEVLVRMGNLTEAAKLVASPKNGAEFILAGKIAALQGNFDAAIKAFDDAAKKEPLNPSMYLGPATLLAELGKGEEALARMQNFQKNKNLETTAFFAVLGDAHEARGNAEEAEKAYKQALDKDDANVRALLGVGRLLIAKKQWEPAGENLEKVTQLMPDNGDPWVIMAGAYIEQKDYEYAAQMADKAADLYRKRHSEPRYVIKALQRAAKAYELAKNKKEAEKRMKDAEELAKIS